MNCLSARKVPGNNASKGVNYVIGAGSGQRDYTGYRHTTGHFKRGGANGRPDYNGGCSTAIPGGSMNREPPVPAKYWLTCAPGAFTTPVGLVGNLPRNAFRGRLCVHGHVLVKNITVGERVTTQFQLMAASTLLPCSGRRFRFRFKHCWNKALLSGSGEQMAAWASSCGTPRHGGTRRRDSTGQWRRQPRGVQEPSRAWSNLLRFHRRWSTSARGWSQRPAIHAAPPWCTRKSPVLCQADSEARLIENSHRFFRREKPRLAACCSNRSAFASSSFSNVPAWYARPWWSVTRGRRFPPGLRATPDRRGSKRGFGEQGISGGRAVAALEPPRSGMHPVWAAFDPLFDLDLAGERAGCWLRGCRLLESGDLRLT